jgi:outer membrane protein assembly factor BamB
MRLRLRAGWNRLLLKAFHGRGNHEGWKFNAIVVDRPGAPAEERNILWAAELPDRSTATPLIVGDRIVVLAEPDQVVCLDKKTGRPLWTRFLGLYQATPEAVRNANPAFREKVEPLVARLPDARGIAERFELRRKIDAALVAIDPGTYKLSWDGHMASHFYIVGWTQPSPCTDGRAVYAYCGNGVAASFDLEGNTRWIRRVNTGELHYPAAPALVDGRFVLFAGGGFNLVALDAATGEVAWRQPAVTRNVGALIGATINGVGVVVTQQGEIVRASDGRLLYGDAKKPAGDTGWAPPCCLGDTVYLPWYGITSLRVMDFAGAAGDAWTCRKRFEIGDIAVSRSRAGKWIDRWSCGSPLIHEGIYYAHDVFGTLYAVDLETRKVLYRQDLSADLDPFTHYNAVGVAASISLGGRHLFVMDNQGTTVVFEPGPVFRKVAVNRLERQIDRPWPVRPQEETGYSPPLFEGSRMYLRGEEFLYCLGRE